MTLFWPNGNFDVANATFTQFVNNNADLNFSTSGTVSLSSFYALYTLVFESSNPTGFNTLMGSRLIPETVVRDQPDEFARLLVQMKGQSTMASSLLGNFVAGGQASNTSNRYNSVNPAWRTALLHMGYGRVWSDHTSMNDQQTIAAQITRQVQMFDTLSNGSQFNSYMNEADPNEPSSQQKSFGSQAMYDRLKAIKQNADPQGLFVCKNCVGSDDWTSDLNCPKTVDPPITSSSIQLTLALPFVFVVQIILLAS